MPQRPPDSLPVIPQPSAPLPTAGEALARVGSSLAGPGRLHLTALN